MFRSTRATRAWVLSLCALVAACDSKTPPPSVTFADPQGPIVKSLVTDRDELPVAEPSDPFVLYFANGFAKNASREDRRAGRNEIRFYNPMDTSNNVTFEVIFENRPPKVFAEFTMKPNNNGVLFGIPSSNEEFFAGSEAWGARITSTAPLMVQSGLAAGVIAPDGDLWFGDPRYKGGYASFQATPTLSRRWFFPDGLQLVWESPGPGRLFQEYEWYHILNPNTEDAQISLRCHYEDGETESFDFTVTAERVRIVNNKELVRANAPHGVEVVSSVPILVSINRFIYDFEDTQDWGAWLHTSMNGTPIEAIQPRSK